MSKDRTKVLQNLVNSSGYLFQLRVEHEIKETSFQHGRQVISCEHPWKDPESGAEGFIDLVLGKHGGRLVVECKRPQDANWVFLISKDQVKQTSNVRCLWMQTEKDLKPISDWDELRFFPESFESAFCIIRGKGEGDQSTLERLSSLLLKSTECLAEEEIRLFNSEAFYVWVYIPAIVTTAELRICRFHPGEVSLNDGKISNAEFESVPFIRFRKSLTTTLTSHADPIDLQEASRDKERTILVINASELTNFLRAFEYKEPGYGDYPQPWRKARARKS